jgi:hypothetical protein
MTQAHDVEESAGGAEDAPPVFIRGVAHALPPGERLLWQGVPEPGLLARHVFHRWFIVGYFAIVTGYWFVRTIGTVAMDAFLPMLLIRLGLAVLVVGTVEFLARVIARTTVYAITSKRIVLKIGMVLPMSINLPFKRIADAAVGRFRDGSGQIALSLVPGNRIAYIALWPHCKVFSINQPKPVLRALRNADEVAAILRDAVVADADSDSDGERIEVPGTSASTATVMPQLQPS